MKLEGSLDAFGLPDIFQLLSYTKKTGGLHLRDGVVDGVVYFASGVVTGASSDQGRQTLARRLVGSGSVDDGPLQDAVNRARQDGVGVGRALLDAGSVGPEPLQQAATEQAVDAVAVLLGWPEGDFSFSVDEANPDDVGVELPTERLVAEATGRRETADRAAATITSPDLVLAMPVVPPSERALSPDEWALVALADGRRTVAQIVELTGTGYVTVVQALTGLVARGMLQPAGREDDHAASVVRRLALLAPLERPGPATATAQQTPTRAAEPDPAESGPPARVAPAAATAPAAAVPAPTAASANGSFAPRAGSFAPATPAPVASAVPAPAPTERSFVATIGGAHVPEDVVPPRPEPFQPRRQPDHPEDHPAAQSSRSTFEPQRSTGESVRPLSMGSSVGGGVGGVNGSAAMAAELQTAAVIERDPSVNRSLLLRLIAGVRGL